MKYLELIEKISNMKKFSSGETYVALNLMLNHFGNPQKKFKFVHVAGTNGKGSVCQFVSSILFESGYKVGLFSSPSVFLYNERFVVNKENASDDLIEWALQTVFDAQNLIENEYGVEFNAFEIEFVSALLIFEKLKCEVVVLETGLGGKKDTTNVIEQKEVAVITKIGLDHMNILGNSLKEIAEEKFGIAKTFPLVVCHQNKVVDSVFQKSQNIFWAENAENLKDDCHQQNFLWKGHEYCICLIGKHQIENARLALKTVEVLKDKGWKISQKNIEEGLKKARNNGRFEIFEHGDKTFVIDGAHNLDGIYALKESISRLFCGKKICLIVGMFGDKATEQVAKLWSEFDVDLKTVSTSGKRALTGAQLKKMIVENAKQKIVAEDFSALQNALTKTIAQNYEVICITGSLSLMKEAREEVLKLCE